MGKPVLMPKMGMTMESGQIVKWLVKEGDRINKGDPIFEVETDKVALEVESLVAGTLLKIYYGPGETLPINHPIAFIGEPGEAIPDVNTLSAGASTEEGSPKSGNKQEEDDSKAVNKTGLNFDSDLVVVGGGPGGYVAAIRAGQLGAKVILVEKDNVGGTCLNLGCIPTKALVRNAEIWRNIKESGKMGIEVKEASFDWNKIKERKNQIVAKLVGGVKALLKRNQVELLKGVARIVDPNTVAIELADGTKKTVTTKYIILATGTVPMKLNIEITPDTKIHDTNTIFYIPKLPKSIAIIGGGVIGAEFASIFNSFGVKVTIIELMPSILSMADNEVSSLITQEFSNNGIDILTGVKVKGVQKVNDRFRVMLEDGKNVEAEEVLMAAGRKIEDGAFKELGLKRNSRGYVETNDKMQTSIDNIFAIGDITGTIQLAHVASAQGIVAAENIFGKGNPMEYEVIPNCIFTNPEVAWVGLTEQQAKDKKIPYKASKFPFFANGKAFTLGHTEGFVKIISDSRWNEILGVHIVGPEASSLIHEAVMVMKLEGTLEDVATTVHAHPTLAEAIMEAAAESLNKSINI
ncbi:MAG: dihydrolipoyl dehydrogenase [Bacteroidota bacterium]